MMFDLNSPAYEAGQKCIIGVEGTLLDDTLREHLRAILPAGVILFERNVVKRSQLKGFTG